MDFRRHSRADRRRKKKEDTPVERRKHRQQSRSVEIRLEQEDRKILIFLKNEIVSENCFDVREYMDRVLNPHATDQVIVDLKEVPYMDSAALGTLVDLRNQLQEVGVEIYIANPSKHVTWLIDALQLNKVLLVK